MTEKDRGGRATGKQRGLEGKKNGSVRAVTTSHNMKKGTGTRECISFLWNRHRYRIIGS